MPQSLLGLLALSLAMLISFNQKRLTHKSYESTIRDEVSLAASGTAQHVMELISSRSFDEVSTPEKVFQAGTVPYGAGLFARQDQFGGNPDCDLMSPFLTPGCDDVDDVHSIRDAPVHARLSDGRTLDFTVDVDVIYVDDPGSQEPSLVPTLHKRVDLTLHSELPSANPDGMLHITRVVSYDPVRADAEMEAVCGPIGLEGSPCAIGGGSGTIDD